MTDVDTCADVRLDDAELAREIAAAAARELLSIRDGGPESGRRGDRAAQEVIAERLRTARPDDAVLSEEAPDDAARLAADRVWIIDPLDGTREYGEAGRVDWAVHVALWEGGELRLGVIALPGLDTVLSSDRPPALEPLLTGLRIAVSRTRPPAVVGHLVEALSAELVPMGSAGFKIAAVITGEVEAYVHAGGQYEWDSAAPVAVAAACGLHVSRIDGSPLRYNQADPLLPDLVVCRAEHADRILQAIREAS